MRGKGSKPGERKGSKLGEPCPKVRLSQDRLPIEQLACMKSKVRGGEGSKLGEGEGSKLG